MQDVFYNARNMYCRSLGCDQFWSKGRATAVCLWACTLPRDGGETGTLLPSRKGLSPLERDTVYFLAAPFVRRWAPGVVPCHSEAEVQMLISCQTAVLGSAFQIRLQTPLINCLACCSLSRISSFSVPSNDPWNNSLSRDSPLKSAVLVVYNWNNKLQRHQ